METEVHRCPMTSLISFNWNVPQLALNPALCGSKPTLTSVISSASGNFYLISSRQLNSDLPGLRHRMEDCLGLCGCPWWPYGLARLSGPLRCDSALCLHSPSAGRLLSSLFARPRLPWSFLRLRCFSVSCCYLFSIPHSQVTPDNLFFHLIIPNRNEFHVCEAKFSWLQIKALY